jgi:hypothetical protein
MRSTILNLLDINHKILAFVTPLPMILKQALREGLLRKPSLKAQK